LLVSLEEMKAVRIATNQRWVVVDPSFRPVATKQQLQRLTKLICQNQTNERHKQRPFQLRPGSPGPPHNQANNQQGRPRLYIGWRIGEPFEPFETRKVLLINKLCEGS